MRHPHSRFSPHPARVLAAAALVLLAACGGSGEEGETAIFTMSAADVPEQWQPAVTPVAGGDILAFDDGYQVHFASVEASASELLDVMEETSGLDIAFPSHVPDEFVLEMGVLTRSPAPGAGTEEGFSTSMLVWTLEPAAPYETADRGTRIAIVRWPGTISLNEEDVTVAELDNGRSITAPVFDDMPEGALSPDYHLHPPEGSEDPVTYILNVHPMVDAAVDEDDIVAMLTSLVE